MTAPPILASSLISLETASRRRGTRPSVLPTSCSSIDSEALNGGFPYGRIISLAGSASTGKTLISMHALTTHLLTYPKSQAAWVDAMGTFSPILLQQVVTQRAQDSSGNKDVEKVESVLDRVQIMRVFDMYGVIEVVEELKQQYEVRKKERELKKRVIMDSEGEESDEELEDVPNGDDGEGDEEGVGVLVVDTISQPISGLMHRMQPQGHGLLVAFSRSLSLLAQDLNICVLLLNTAVTLPFSTPNPSPSIFASTSTKPGLGSTYAYCVDLSISLSKHPHNVSDAEEAAAAMGEGQWKERHVGWKEDVVFEVLGDRFGGLTGNWGAFRAEEAKLINAFELAPSPQTNTIRLHEE